MGHGGFCFCIADMNISKDNKCFCRRFYVGFGGVSNQISSLSVQNFRVMLGGDGASCKLNIPTIFQKSKAPRHPGFGCLEASLSRCFLSGGPWTPWKSRI